MACRKGIDSRWPEVKCINDYVLLLVSLEMAVRGLGFLVLTWTSVVLLGGFVSMLRQEDFWCLTVITFVQIAGVVHFYKDERLPTVGKAVGGLLVLGYVYAQDRQTDTRGVVRVVALVKEILGWIASLAQATVALIVTFVFVVGLLRGGLFIAAGLSSWRLIQQDYGNTDGDGSKANMNAALGVLYILVVVQFATMAYKKIISWPVRGRIVDRVAEKYGFTGQQQAVAYVSDYFRYIMKGCSKDPTFAHGKNLVTYAVDLMGPNKSPEEYQSGTRVLGTLLRCFKHSKPAKFDGQRRLIRQLVGSSSSSHILQKLLQMLDSRSRPYDRKVRECAATIVAFVADDIHLEQFPEELQCLSSLIETFKDWYVRDWYQQGRDESSDTGIDDPDLRENYVTLLAHGMLIFHKLTSNWNNCRVISKTPGLLSKIMAPVTADLLHCTDHPTWIEIVKLSLMLMVRLAAAPGETGAKVREEISTDKEAMGSMKIILSCDKCKECDGLHIPVMEILTQIYMDSKDTERSFIKMLVRIFTDDNEESSSRKMAGEALGKLSLHSECSAGFILKAEDDVVDHLSKILLDLQLQNKVYKIGAAEILENLCSQYTTDDECLNELKIAMTAAIPKALGEIYYFCGLVGDESHTGTQPQLSDQGRLSETDIENQCDHQQHNNQGNITSPSDPQNNEQGEDKNKNEEFHATLFSLCVTVCDKLISADQDLAHHFYANAPANGVSSFPRKLKDMVEKMRHPRPTCLRMLKLTSMMVISMMKHRCSYPKQDLESLMESLSTASQDMFLLDGSMIFANGRGGAVPTKPLRRSLVSLVEEAHELVDKYEPQEIEVLATPTPVREKTN